MGRKKIERDDLAIKGRLSFDDVHKEDWDVLPRQSFHSERVADYLRRANEGLTIGLKRIRARLELDSGEFTCMSVDSTAVYPTREWHTHIEVKSKD